MQMQRDINHSILGTVDIKFQKKKQKKFKIFRDIILYIRIIIKKVNKTKEKN